MFIFSRNVLVSSDAVPHYFFSAPAPGAAFLKPAAPAPTPAPAPVPAPAPTHGTGTGTQNFFHFESNQ